MNVTIPWPSILKRKRGFEIKRVLRLYCASPHFLCVFAKWVMCLHWVEDHDYCIIHVYLCVNVFVVRTESEGEALTDF